MKIREIKAKSVLSKSQVYDYTLNPYVGCEHGCLYCYAKFMIGNCIRPLEGKGFPAKA
jgi:DNA repair photolyase